MRLMMALVACERVTLFGFTVKATAVRAPRCAKYYGKCEKPQAYFVPTWRQRGGKLNRDVPYHDFGRERIAVRRLVALGLVALG